LEEQNAIAKVITFFDERINLLERELTQWQQKKKALMQLLLTGIVRVSV
jgi:type I restriction enzyme S subunit